MENSNFTQLDIYKKALEIFQVSRGIACSVSNSKHVIEMEISTDSNEQVAGEIVTHSLKLVPELAAIQNSSTTRVRLKRVKKIRKLARLINDKCRKLEYTGIRDREFLLLLLAELKHFDQLFNDWLNKLQLKH